ncbi:hypothetical protein NLJ89_g12336 [Agrocybe chaxingu]|uniref:Uncharacterized protein n=1 Tax=Agrocybe chaxingu TaxID=84603 RepID=A0A9W8JNH7_9AGAR|nr:hypothetical protein NLJ89_g12336 [Agrocybe chaxingu]
MLELAPGFGEDDDEAGAEDEEAGAEEDPTTARNTSSGGTFSPSVRCSFAIFRRFSRSVNEREFGPFFCRVEGEEGMSMSSAAIVGDIGGWSKEESAEVKEDEGWEYADAEYDETLNRLGRREGWWCVMVECVIVEPELEELDEEVCLLAVMLNVEDTGDSGFFSADGLTFAGALQMPFSESSVFKPKPPSSVVKGP